MRKTSNPVHTCAWFLVIVAASPGCEKPQDAPPQESVVPPLPYSMELRDGRLRIFHGSPPVLTRCRPDPRPVLPAEERRDLLRQEEETTRKWRLARARMETNTWPSEDDEHDARLETTERLEKFLEDVPDHLGAARDLLSTYRCLFGLEGGSPTGARLIQVASRRLQEFEDRIGPPDPADARFIRGMRAWLFFMMKIPPLALEELKDLPADPAMLPVREGLRALGQDAYLAIDGDPIENLRTRIFHPLRPCPNPDLLWGEAYMILEPKVGPGPARTVAGVLARKGSGDARRYYLFLHSTQGQSLITLYGGSPPSASEFRARMMDLARTGLEEKAANR